MAKIKSKKIIDVFDIPNQKHLGKIKLSEVNKKYDEWRKKGYGVLVDISGDIAIDNEDCEDDGLYYQEQIDEYNKE